MNGRMHSAWVLWCMLMMSMIAMAQGVPTWQRTTHDFGTFRDSLKTVTTAIKVENTGDSALMITRVQSNWGCTVAEYTRGVMQPGDTGSVTINYSAGNIAPPVHVFRMIEIFLKGYPTKFGWYPCLFRWQIV